MDGERRDKDGLALLQRMPARHQLVACNSIHGLMRLIHLI